MEESIVRLDCNLVPIPTFIIDGLRQLEESEDGSMMDTTALVSNCLLYVCSAHGVKLEYPAELEDVIADD